MRPDRRSFRRATPLVLLLAVHACDPALQTSTMDPEVGRAPLVVTRGALEERLVLTGEVDAAKSVELSVPRTDEWNLSIRWLAEDGTLVKKGDRVVEFDNSAVVDRISELELSLIEAAIELDTQQATNAVESEDKRFAVETQKTAVAKAKLDAEIPAELVSRRDSQQFALELARAKVALATAESDLKSVLDGGKYAEEVKRIATDKALRALESVEQQLGALAVVAPQDGVVLIADQPWEGRKFQVGDNVWPGLTVAKLPDLSEMVIEAKLSDVDDGRVQPGMRVSCTVDAFPDRPLAGFIASVSPVAHESGQQSLRRFFAVKIELEEADPEVLRPGLSVKVEVITRHEDDVLVAPRAALDSSADKVLAHLQDGREVEVAVDFCTGQACVLLSGLDEGDVLRAREEDR